MSNYITDTYSLKYYGETENYRGQQSRVEIWWKGTVDATFPRRIGDITALSLSINGNEDIDASVVKTILNLSMADTWDEPQVAAAGAVKHGVWDEFYTPDSTAYLVRLYTRQHGDSAWEPRWSGYITPDNWRESISYRGAVSIVARDNLGHLQDFGFDLPADADGMVSAYDVITGALAKIAFPMDVILGIAADGGRATLLEADAATGSRGVWDALILASQFEGKSWEDAFETVLDSLGLTVRFVDNNTVAITFIRNLPLCGDTGTPASQSIEFYGPGTRLLVPAYREVKINMDYDYRQSVPFPGKVTGAYGADESFGWSYYDERQHRRVSGTAMRTDVVAVAKGWGSAGKAFVNTGTYRTSSRREGVATVDPETTALIIANAVQADVRAAMAIYNFGPVNTPAGRVRLNVTGGLSLAGQYLIRYGSLESLEWAASYQTDDALLWWNGSQWKANEQTWTLSENGEMDFSAPMNIQDVPDGGTLRVYIRDVKVSAGFCVGVNGVTLSGNDPSSSLVSDEVTVVNNPAYNVRAERNPDFAPMSKRVAWNIPENYPNILWRRRSGAIGPFPYEVIWSDGEERLPLPVQWAKQTLMFHHSTLQQIEGVVGVPERGAWRFDRLTIYKGHYFLPQGGTLDLLTGHLTGASLREFIDYATLWAGGVTVAPQTASFPSEGGSVSFLLTCADDKDWIVTGLPDWLTADTVSGTGSGVVTLTASRNDGGTRSRTVYIGGVAVRVEQGQEEFGLAITPASVDVPEEGQTLYLTVEASPSAGWKVVSTAPEWVFVNGLNEWEGEGYNDALLISVQENETGAPRSASLLLYDEEDTLVQTVPVTQTAEAAELTLTITTNVPSPTIILTVDGNTVPYSAGMVVASGALVGVSVSKSGYTTVTDSFTMTAANQNKYYELGQDIEATISFPDEITYAAQAVRMTISDPSNHGWNLDWTSELYLGYITGGAVVSGNAHVDGYAIVGTGDAVVTLSVSENTGSYGRTVGDMTYDPIFFRDTATSGYTYVTFYQNDRSASIVPVTKVTLNKSTLGLNVGGTSTLTATVAPSNATDQSLTWTSSNTSVATVTQAGKVTAVGAGTCTIRATANDGSGKYGSCAVTVSQSTVSVTGVSLDKSTTTINAGGTKQLTATVYPANATNKNVSWSSSDTSVATVNSSGLVTAVAAGLATITVTTADGGYTATCGVTVRDTPVPADPGTISVDDISVVGSATSAAGTIATERIHLETLTASTNASWVSRCYIDMSGVTPMVRMQFSGNGSATARTATITVSGTDTSGTTITTTFSLTQAASSSSDVPCTAMTIDGPEGLANSSNEATYAVLFTPESTTQKSATWSLTDSNGNDVSDKVTLTPDGLRCSLKIIDPTVRNLLVVLRAVNDYNGSVSASLTIMATYTLPADAIQVSPGSVTVAPTDVSDTTPVLTLASGIAKGDLVVTTSGFVTQAGVSNTLHILTSFTANTGSTARYGTVTVSYTDPDTLETASVTVSYFQPAPGGTTDIHLSAIALNVEMGAGTVMARFLVTFRNGKTSDYTFKALGYTLSGVDGDGEPTFAARTGTLNEKTVAALSTESEIYTVTWRGSVAGTTQYTLTVRNGTQLSSTRISDGNDFI